MYIFFHINTFINKYTIVNIFTYIIIINNIDSLTLSTSTGLRMLLLSEEKSEMDWKED